MSFTTILDASLDVTFSDMLRRAFRANTAKLASPWASVSHRTIEAWLQHRREPGAFALLRLSRHSGFRAELRAYLDHIEQQEADVALQVSRNRAIRAGEVADLQRAIATRRRARAGGSGGSSAQASGYGAGVGEKLDRIEK